MSPGSNAGPNYIPCGRLYGRKCLRKDLVAHRIEPRAEQLHWYDIFGFRTNDYTNTHTFCHKKMSDRQWNAVFDLKSNEIVTCPRYWNDIFRIRYFAMALNAFWLLILWLCGLIRFSSSGEEETLREMKNASECCHAIRRFNGITFHSSKWPMNWMAENQTFVAFSTWRRRQWKYICVHSYS